MPHNEPLSIAVRTATKMCRPCESTLAIHPQGNPAFVRLSANISQYFTDIITERFNPSCCVDITDCVANERVHAGGGVTEAGSIVVVECEHAANCVVVTSGVARERFSSDGSVVATGGIVT
jgi:hypothetical protein